MNKTKKSIMFAFMMVLTAVIVTASTMITDSYVKSNIKNPYTGYTGNFEDRPLFSEGDVTVYVNANGSKNYTTIQAALDDIPIILNHNYRIYVDDGDYDEDIVVGGTIQADYNHPTEGSVRAIYVLGSSGDRNAVTVNSIRIAGVTGTNSPTFQYMTVDDCDPTSDENVSISAYHSNHPQFVDLNITGNCRFGIMAYASSIQVARSNFEGQESAIITKRNGNALWDDTVGPYSSGTVDYLARVNSGFVDIVDYSNITTSVSLVDCGPKGGFATDSDGHLYCMNGFDSVNSTGNIYSGGDVYLGGNDVLEAATIIGNADSLNRIFFDSNGVKIKTNNGAGGAQDSISILEGTNDIDFQMTLDMNSKTIKNVNVLASTEMQNSGTPTVGGVLCVKADGRFGQCTDAPGAGGTCTCA